MMRLIKLSVLMMILLMFAGCKDASVDNERMYVFIKPYCAVVTVGGVVGLAEKCFSVGDTVKGKQLKPEVVTIRIAAHGAFDDGPPSPNSYQEFLDVPSDNLKLTGK